MKRVALHNLGCKVNAYEMDIMQQMLVENGYKIVPFDEIADIYIINTCTVTNIADRKSRQMIHQAKKRNPSAVVVAAGCFVQANKDVCGEDGADLLIGNNRKKDLISILQAYLEAGAEEKSAYIEDINAPCEYEEMTLKRTAEHCRAYIKIQDGCNQFCSYCIIPYARGRVRSRRWEDIYEEIKGIAEEGYKEIVLTGIHLSSYGTDFDEEAWQQKESRIVRKENGGRDYAHAPKLIDLLERIHEIPGIERIRLGSLEPRIITRENVERMAKLKKLCPHFHLSLQSGCDETLVRMNRHYTIGAYLDGVRLLRTYFAHPAVTTDVIVGFPGESEVEFAATKAFLQKAKLYEMHIFKYSKRKGTAAAKLPDPVPAALQKTRSEQLFAIERKLSAEFRQFYVGKEAEVLFEEEKEIEGKTWQVGHTREYVLVAKESGECLNNRILSGRISGFLKEDVLIME